MPQGKEACLAAIFGDDWDQIGSPGERKEFGRLFKAAESEAKVQRGQKVKRGLKRGQVLQNHTN